MVWRGLLKTLAAGAALQFLKLFPMLPLLLATVKILNRHMQALANGAMINHRHTFDAGARGEIGSGRVGVNGPTSIAGAIHGAPVKSLAVCSLENYNGAWLNCPK